MTDEVICAWCGKPQSAVKRMIVGSGFYKPMSETSICNECVELCATVLATELSDYREGLIAKLIELRQPDEPNSN